MRKLVIVVLVIAALVVTADVVARNVAEKQLADHVDSHEGVTGTAVDIQGVSFLLQAAKSEFGEVDVTFPALQTASSAGQDLQVDDVRLTLHDVTTADRFTRAVAQRVEGSGTVSYHQLSERLGVDISFDEGSGGLLITLPRLGISTRVEPSVDNDGALTLGGLPGPVQQLLGDAGLGFSGLPDDVAVTAIRATQSGLEVTLEARDVRLAR